MEKLRLLPKIDTLVANSAFLNLSHSLVLSLSRKVVEKKREQILSGDEDVDVELEAIISEVLNAYDEIFEGGTKPVINATGVIVHTNLGRSRISEELYERAKNLICRYSDLEYNIEDGVRGERYKNVANSFKILFDIEDVLVVNNNASAVFLILNTFVKNKEAIVSRGELVEIGGSFRVPDVMSESGAILKEVGTTNKTKISDYENNINENTSMLMKVHQSNFSIEGFSESATYSDIKNLADKRGLIDYFDLGSRYVGELPYNLSSHEPSLEKILKDRPSLISFSGDKLFGSIQAGIIFGKKELIAKLKKNQLLRMLRVDKITLALLEESLRAYILNDLNLIITRKLLSVSVEELEQRAYGFVQRLENSDICEVVNSCTFVGGGTLPNKKLPTVCVSFLTNAKKLEKLFREHLIIGRIENDRFMLDFRSIDKDEDTKLLNITKQVLKNFS
ncbi:MAG: L-seryl-tRNA(Sec) selenium transferase [Campylobacteraceae bacterium]